VKVEISSQTKANEARRSIIDLGYRAGRNGAHFGSSLSLVDIITNVYKAYFQFGVNQSKVENRTKFILSKGHGALGYFSVLEAFGYINSSELSGFEKNGSNLFAHAHKDLSKGIEYSGGSLGLGVSFAVGVAIANKLKKIESKVIVLVGDGECDEGIVWEALMSASNYDLTNFMIIIDKNGMQSDGNKSKIMDQKNLCEKLTAFGFCVEEVDGHNHTQISDALTRKSLLPRAIVANTVKGKGISFMENNADWHHGSLTQKQYDLAINELNNSV
jgi:transketolase